MARKNDLQVALLLDLSDFAPGLKKAKDDSKAAAGVIGTTLDSLAANIATRVVTMESALKLAEKGLKEFVKTAQELEKSGEGNEGTAAVSRVSNALGMLEKEIVKAITGTEAFKVVAGALAETLEIAAISMGSFDQAGQAVGAALGSMSIALAKFLDDAVKSGADALARLIGIQRNSDSMFGSGDQGGLEMMARGAGAGDAMARFAALRKAAEAKRIEGANRPGKRVNSSEKLLGKVAAEQKKAMADAKRALARDEDDAIADARRAQEDAQQNAARYSTAKGSVVDAFVNSWQSGLSRLGDLFRGFSADVSKSLGGMSGSTTKALGDTFDSAAFLGPQLERVYGQSAKGAAKFQAAQLALVGALAVVKGAMSAAEAVDLLSTDPGAAAAKLAAAVGYAGAAALAGYSAAQTLAGQPGGAQGGGFATSEQLGQERRQVTVVIQNAVGGEEFVRREVMPAINRAVRADAVLYATTSQSAGSLQPGRY